jgi:tRNA (adenine57-N1/adenine58-N1)-methyltransferase catalytic subunit
MSRPFRAGERILLFDAKGRRYLVTLAGGGEFHTHSGPVDHDQVLGRDEGVVVRSSGGARYTAVRPTLAEVVLKMPRGAQVIYPKDLGPILMMGDIFPGALVLESGLGSGALSMALLRAGARVTGYEIRADFAARAQANVAGFLGSDALERYRVRVQDIYEGIEETGFDRMVLDLPEPWRLVEDAEAVLRPGGILVSYLPTIGQVSTLRTAIDKSRFGMAETIEVLQRSWHIEGQSVRPDHRMVAHTGFLTSARLLGDSSGGAIASVGSDASVAPVASVGSDASEPEPEDAADEWAGPG